MGMGLGYNFMNANQDDISTHRGERRANASLNIQENFDKRDKL
jgi:hypothetical protein